MHLSKEEQRKKLLERIKRAEKKWKFSPDDIEDREHWDEYMKVYEEAFNHTSSDLAPWYIIPDNHRWFARATVAAIISEKLKSLHSKYPVIDKEQQKEMAKAKSALEKEDIPKD